ncbi:MAG: F0F1 ATP synthase subunit B [Kiritimatiellaeota bacterium]|nr:F0F1 ATP synthase subunit B [Kiritimatiellota bacterium]
MANTAQSGGELLTETVVARGASQSRRAESGGASALLRPDPGLVIWTWLIFFALLLFFRKFGLGPLISSMEERENLISSAVDDAKSAKKELAEINATRDNILADAKKEMESIIREGRRKSEETAQAILENAKKNAEKMINDARGEIERERRASLLKLKKDIVDLSLMAAAKVSEREIGGADNEKYVEKVITELSA